MSKKGPTAEELAAEEKAKIMKYLNGYIARLQLVKKEAANWFPGSSNINTDDVKKQREDVLNIMKGILDKYRLSEDKEISKKAEEIAQLANKETYAIGNFGKPNDRAFLGDHEPLKKLQERQAQKLAEQKTPPPKIEAYKNVFSALKQLRKGIRLISSALNTLSIALGFQKAPPKRFDPKKFLETLKEIETEMAARVKAQDQLKAKGPVNREEMVRVAKEIEDKKAAKAPQQMQAKTKPTDAPPLPPREALGPLPTPKVKEQNKEWTRGKVSTEIVRQGNPPIMGNKQKPEKAPTGITPPPTVSASKPAIVTAVKHGFVRDQRARIDQREEKRLAEAAEKVKGKPPKK